MEFEWTEWAEKEPAEVFDVARDREAELNVDEVILTVLSR